MTFEEWIAEYPCEVNVCVKADMNQAWEAGVQEGIDRMYKLYDLDPRETNAVQKHILYT